MLTKKLYAKILIKAEKGKWIENLAYRFKMISNAPFYSASTKSDNSISRVLQGRITKK